MNVWFDSRSRLCKEPFGCMEEKAQLSVTIYVKDAEETGVLFLLAKDGEAETALSMDCLGVQNGYRAYRLCRTMHEPGLYFYCFQLQTASGERMIFRDERNRPCPAGESRWQLTVYRRGYNPPESCCGRVMYQIFPDRFNRAGLCDLQEKLTPFYLHENLSELPFFQPDAEGRILNHDFFGGNLAGIVEKLPYLQQLGVSVLYLNPIFMAYSNHRYDTADYRRIDPMLGTTDDFKALCGEAHRRGMRVILDGVFSHTGSDSRYFDKQNRFGGGACHDPDSPYRDWYQFQTYPHSYTSWWGIETLPCVNEENPGYLDYIVTGADSVVKYWLRQGADGWRLDVADELPDGFLSALYGAVKAEKPEGLVIGEVWEDASNKISYGTRRHYLQGDCLDSVMNYVWRDAIIRFVRGKTSAAEMNEQVLTLCEHYPAGSLHTMMNILSTHDTARILTVLADKTPPEARAERAHSKLCDAERQLAKSRLFAAAFLLFTLPGCPCVYYGDEIGMEGYEDPFNRAYMGDREQDEEILACYRALGALKNSHAALQRGRLEPAFCSEGLYGFYRLWQEEKILCVVNASPEPQALYAAGDILYKRNLWEKGGERLLLPYAAAAIKLHG